MTAIKEYIDLTLDPIQKCFQVDRIIRLDLARKSHRLNSSAWEDMPARGEFASRKLVCRRCTTSEMYNDIVNMYILRQHLEI